MTRGRRILENITSGCTDHIEALRSKTVSLELEVTVLKAQRVSDRAETDRLESDIAIMREAAYDCARRLDNMGDQLIHIQVTLAHMKDLLDETGHLYATACYCYQAAAPGHSSLATELGRAGQLSR